MIDIGLPCQALVVTDAGSDLTLVIRIATIMHQDDPTVGDLNELPVTLAVFQYRNAVLGFQRPEPGPRAPVVVRLADKYALEKRRVSRGCGG
jgi:hypothetical protein